MNGYWHENDQLWTLVTPEFEADIREYNWELTGYDERLSKLDGSIFHYGSNAWYILGAYAEEKGWKVIEHIRDS